MDKIIERMKKPTPKFFQKIRNVGLTLAAISASILALPLPLPGFVETVAGYLGMAGAVAGAVSQAAVTDDK